MSTDFTRAVLDALDGWGQAGKVARFWLRDDDATEPTPALDRLLALTARFDIPLSLAVIPQPTGAALAERLADAGRVTVTVHGWSHANHAAEPDKKQELGGERPAEVVLGELAEGFDRLRALHGARFRPVLVPPWNRIDTALMPFLPALGYTAISTYGRERPGPLRAVNTHVDVMDWHGARGCRNWDDLGRDIVERLETCSRTGGGVGLLTHHLVHDASVWAFMDRLFEATSSHPACRWVSMDALIADV